MFERIIVAALSATCIIGLGWLGACFLAFDWINMSPTAWRIAALIWVYSFWRSFREKAPDA